MSEIEYEYNGLVARSWDFMHGDTSDWPDRHLFRLLVESHGQPALDVGCGTGRLLLDFRANGIDIDGIDISPEMVAICEEKAQALSLPVTVYTQPVEAMDLPRTYKTIIIPSYAFQLVTDLDDAKQALDNFYNHLLPGGTLIMAVWHITTEGQDIWGDWWLVGEKEGFEGDKTLKRWERSRYDADTQLRHTESRYELFKDGKRVYIELHRRSPELRNYSLSQLTDLMEASGFVGVHAVSGLENEPAAVDDSVFYIIGSSQQESIV